VLARIRNSAIFAPCSSERLLQGGQIQRLKNEIKSLTARAVRSKTRPAFEIVTQMPSRQDGIGTEVFCPLNLSGKSKVAERMPEGQQLLGGDTRSSLKIEMCDK